MAQRFLTWFAAMVVAVFCLVGCSISGTLYRLGSNTTDAQRAAIVDAMDLVNEHVLEDKRVSLFVEGADDPNDPSVWTISFVDDIPYENNGHPIGLTCRRRDAKSKWCPTGGQSIRVLSTLDYAGRKVVSAHELLHSLELEHLPEPPLTDPHSIMSRVTIPGAHWTPDDSAECARVGACSVIQVLPAPGFTPPQ